MKSLLIVTEMFDIGGPATSIRGEIIALTRAGCRVHLATGQRFNTMLLPEEVASVTHNLSLDPDASITDLAHAVDMLRRLIRDHAIDCVHAHPFTALLPALIAAQQEGVQCSLTLHGPVSLAACYGPIYDLILTSAILPSADLVIAVSEETAKLAAPYLPNRKALILPNGVDFSRFSSLGKPTDADPRWLVVSRLDPFKIGGIADFIRKAKLAGIPGVRLLGDGPAREELQQCLNNEGLSKFVEFCDAGADIPRLMQSAAGIAGMGRVALEGLASRKPVCLLGYDGVKGLIDRGMLSMASKANFSGRNLGSIDSQAFCEQFEQIAKIDVDALHRSASEKFSEHSVWRCFLKKLDKTKPQASILLAAIYRAILADNANEATPWLQSTALLEHLSELTHGAKHSKFGLLTGFRGYRDRLDELRSREACPKQSRHAGRPATSTDRQQFSHDALLKRLEQLRQARSGQLVWRLRCSARALWRRIRHK